ncbi:Asp-tRNA(Asn)/Glu-tRNA(Gln) amidotransferase subunit GatB [Patescibacteria group bacterium]|nr:Asp-tRNA(Asn)/Glu-tRNA(Gln) amidotransferase subunit GatB [Patescibacteria group bacterium]
MNYQPIIGLEVHVELNTRSKMFCSCPNDLSERHPNVNICPICLAHPGTLPVINKIAVRSVIKTGLALNCQIPEYSKFDRKNYFYPDLPKGYQISQYDMPLCKGGFLNINPSILRQDQGRLESNQKAARQVPKKIRIQRIHLEEDTGRLIHPEKESYSLVDFNRAGIPLMELVTDPDFRSAVDARRFAEELRLILRYLKVSDADMEKGQLRVEVNISLIRANSHSDGKSGIQVGQSKMGTKVEIKNLNSLRVVEKAIDYEIERQAEILKSGKKIIQETRGWSDSKEVTVSQREKEQAHDYRYFPEPDLPVLHITKKEIEGIKSEIPELPQQKRERFQKEYQLPDEEIEILVFFKDLGEYFEKVMSELRNWVKEVELKTKISENEFQRLIKLASNYILTDLQALLRHSAELSRSQGISVSGKDFLITPENFAEFITLIYEGKISSKIAKMILNEMFQTGADPSHIIKEKGLELITDTAEIEKIVKVVLAQDQKAVKDYKKGKEGTLQFLVGQVMKESRGKADPQIAADFLKKLIT